MESVGKSRQVIHLHILKSDEHHYFGSISAMYDNFSPKQIGVALDPLQFMER